MRRTRLVLYCAAMVAWTVALLLAATSALDAAKVALVIAIAVALAASAVGIGHAGVLLARHWRTNGLPTWRGRR